MWRPTARRSGTAAQSSVAASMPTSCLWAREPRAPVTAPPPPQHRSPTPTRARSECGPSHCRSTLPTRLPVQAAEARAAVSAGCMICVEAGRISPGARSGMRRRTPAGYTIDKGRCVNPLALVLWHLRVGVGPDLRGRELWDVGVDAGLRCVVRGLHAVLWAAQRRQRELRGSGAAVRLGQPTRSMSDQACVRLR